MKALRPASLQQLTGSLTRFPVGCQHLCNGGGMRLRRGCEHFLNCTRDAHKGDTTFEECLDGYLVGGVEGDAVGSSNFGGCISQTEARETLEVGGSNSRWRRAARSKVSVLAGRSGYARA